MSRLKWLVTLAVAVVPLAASATVYFYRPDPDRLNEAIQKIGFYPITPPTNLRAPGSIYHVSSDGKYYTMLCQVQPERLLSVTRTSPTNKQVSTELRKARLGISAEILQQVQSSSNAKLLEAIKLELDDVEVLEVSLEDLAIIADELLGRGTCDKVVRKYLEEGDYICQGQQVVKATTTYTVAVNNAAGGELTRVAEVIKLNYSSDVRVEGGRIVSGKNLYYGMKLAPRCLYLPGQSSKRPPLTRWERILNHFNVPDLLL